MYTEALKQALHRLTEPALDRLAERGPLPKKLTHKVEHGGSYSLLKDDYRSAILTEMHMMLKVPDLAAQLATVANAVEADPDARELLPTEFKGGPTSPEKLSWIATYVVAPFLVHFCEQKAGLWYKESYFNSTYEALRAYLSADTVTLAFIAPLNNFSATFSELELRENLYLGQLTQQEKQELWEDHGGAPGISPGLKPTEILGWSHAIRGRIQIPKGSMVFSGPAQHCVEDVVAILRLYGPNKVGASLLSVTLDPSVPFNPDAFGQGLLAPLPERPAFSGPKYELAEKDVDGLRQTFKHYMTHNRKSAFALAVRRFNLGYDRQSDEDRLIDHWVGLEALFASDSTQELRFRASLRIARYIGESEEERKRLYTDLKALYDLRSDVVHGGDPGSKRRRRLPSLHEGANRTEEILRRALQLWADPKYTCSIEDIDASFLA